MLSNIPSLTIYLIRILSITISHMYSVETIYESGNILPLYILSSSFLASGRRRSPLLFGSPVPRQTGHTNFPRPQQFGHSVNRQTSFALFRLRAFHFPVPPHMSHNTAPLPLQFRHTAGLLIISEASPFGVSIVGPDALINVTAHRQARHFRLEGVVFSSSLPLVKGLLVEHASASSCLEQQLIWDRALAGRWAAAGRRMEQSGGERERRKWQPTPAIAAHLSTPRDL